MKYAVRKFAVVAVVAVIGAALVTGCSKPATTTTSGGAVEPKTVKVGFAAPLTGDNAIYGQGMKRAVELAIEEANASDAVKAAGLTFALRAEDDMGDPKQAVNVANLLAGDTGVVGVVGHFNSGCSIPASPVYNGVKLAMVSVSSNPALTAQGLPNVNRVVAKDDAQGAAAGELVAGKLGLKSVAVIDDSTPYGQGLAEQFVKAFDRQGRHGRHQGERAGQRGRLQRTDHPHQGQEARGDLLRRRSEPGCAALQAVEGSGPEGPAHRRRHDLLG